MAITVGLDFGTHQTKICIEDTADKQNPNYTFWKFKDTSGKTQYVCPSVVQLNDDNTLSYGYVSDENCKKGVYIEYTEPVKPQIEKPQLVLPSLPSLYIIPDINERTFSAEELAEYRRIKSLIAKNNAFLEANHHKLCHLITKRHETEMQNYASTLKEYQAKYANWREKMTTPIPIRYYYFKQAVFSTFEWKYKNVSPMLLSIWYIANIIFDIESVYGQNFAIQMGVPTGAKDLNKKKEIATSILLSAYRLVEDVFNGDKEAFLKSTIEELTAKTDIIPFSNSKKQEYGILIFPEAYAGLRMMTARRKIVHGMNLNIDIGGGTTDISFFTIDNDKPHIYRYESIPKGINWILQEALGEAAILRNRAHLDTESTSKVYNQKVSNAINRYNQSVANVCANIVKMLWSEWIEKMGTSTKNHLTAALQNRPIIYMGGGSTYQKLKKDVGCFTDVHTIDGEFWSGIQIENVGDLYPVLNTALGLSIGEVDDKIEIYSINQLWDGVSSNGFEDDKIDYNLLDIE